MVNTLQIISISFAALFVVGATIAFLRFNLYGPKNMHGVSGSHITVINPSMSLDHQLPRDGGKVTWIEPGSELIIRDLNRQRNSNNQRNAQQRTEQAQFTRRFPGIFKNPFM